MAESSTSRAGVVVLVADPRSDPSAVILAAGLERLGVAVRTLGTDSLRTSEMSTCSLPGFDQTLAGLGRPAGDSEPLEAVIDRSDFGRALPARDSDRSGESEEELFIRDESFAAFTALLWQFPVPVINPRPPGGGWHSLLLEPGGRLENLGLNRAPVLVTFDADEAAAFHGQHGRRSLEWHWGTCRAGTVRVGDLGRRDFRPPGPWPLVLVGLAEAPMHRILVVGERAFPGDPSEASGDSLHDPIRRAALAVARSAGLTFAQISLLATDPPTCVEVGECPDLTGFSEPRIDAMCRALVPLWEGASR